MKGRVESIDWETRKLVFVADDNRRILFSGISLTGISGFTEPIATRMENKFVCEHFEDLYAGIDTAEVKYDDEPGSCTEVLQKWTDLNEQHSND